MFLWDKTAFSLRLLKLVLLLHKKINVHQFATLCFTRTYEHSHLDALTPPAGIAHIRGAFNPELVSISEMIALIMLA